MSAKETDTSSSGILERSTSYMVNYRKKVEIFYHIILGIFLKGILEKDFRNAWKFCIANSALSLEM